MITKAAMNRRLGSILSFFAIVLVPTLAFAQINFPKKSYYVGMGDSIAAGEGALPVTNGYVYRLYDRGVFARKQEMDFADLAVRGGRSWDLRDHQVPQVLCAPPRPTVITITAGANDFFLNDPDLVSITQRVAQAVDLLLNNSGTLNPALGASTVLDPVTHQRCPELQNVTILVSNYYSLPHPVPELFQQLDLVVRTFDQALRTWLALIVVPSGSRLAIVDLYTPSLGRQGLVTIERRLGFTGPFDFDFHPTNLGHAFIAEQFQEVWNNLP